MIGTFLKKEGGNLSIPARSCYSFPKFYVIPQELRENFEGTSFVRGDGASPKKPGTETSYRIPQTSANFSPLAFRRAEV